MGAQPNSSLTVTPSVYAVCSSYITSVLLLLPQACISGIDPSASGFPTQSGLNAISALTTSMLGVAPHTAIDRGDTSYASIKIFNSAKYFRLNEDEKLTLRAKWSHTLFPVACSSADGMKGNTFINHFVG